MKDTKRSIKRLTVSAMLVALGVVVLWLGSMVDVLSISMAVIASLFGVFALLEYGKGTPWLVFAATGILSLLLLPRKEPAVLYVLFFGYYPILKALLERKRPLVAWILKELLFHAALILLLLLSRWLLLGGASEPIFYTVATVLLAEIAFPLYDVALTRLIVLYLRKWRDRLRIGK